MDICLEMTAGEITGQIVDNGQGFDLAQITQRTTRHFGLQGMRERAELLGGSWDVDSTPGQGTRIEFRLPLG